MATTPTVTRAPPLRVVVRDKFLDCSTTGSGNTDRTAVFNVSDA